MIDAAEDRRWLAAAAALAARGVPESRPNPSVGAIIVKAGIVAGRGWTQPGGRPHAEATALDMARERVDTDVDGATLYVTLEPCAHASARGPACADLVAASGISRVVVGCTDPDPRTAGAGIAALRAAGKQVSLLPLPDVERGLAGYLMQRRHGRPFVTLKLATSLDGCIALANGESRWITGDEARAHGHAIRARSDAILVGGGTLRADAPRLDVRLPALAHRSPDRWVMTAGEAPEGWLALRSPSGIAAMSDVQHLLVEGGARTAAAFLAADLVDRLLIYRAPIVIGAGMASIADIGLGVLADAHGRWQLDARRLLGSDTLDVYSRITSDSGAPCSPE